MPKILIILGARPQFIKAAALSRIIREKGRIEEIIVHTGQHFDKNMSDVFFSEMGIPKPHHQLQISGLNHGAMTGRMMEAIEEITLKEKPNGILVFGDTNSTLAGSLVGSKLHIPVIHIEAGLRSFNMEMPEEINRILTDRISSVLFCPTDNAVRNLKKEGFDHFDIEIHQVGDVMEDAAIHYSKFSGEKSTVIASNQLKKADYCLVTCHRAENTDNYYRLNEIIDGINKVASEKEIVWPVHPRMKSIMKDFNLHKKVKLIDPVGYFDMIELIKNSCMVISDSGGLQKEAYFFDKFCVTMRDQTEWTELVEHGYNQIVGASGHKIFQAFSSFSKKKFNKSVQLYGGGKASESIEEKMSQYLQK